MSCPVENTPPGTPENDHLDLVVLLRVDQAPLHHLVHLVVEGVALCRGC
ncbi:MAG: hypothetical protein U5R31_01635 [Acidimicrobiia bacterium]|nr:hypothetical protein [Acidimicrobiia bacterium]